MTVEPQPKKPILEVAWTLYAQLDTLSKKQSKRQYRWYGWISSLGVFAVFLVVITNAFSDNFPAALNLGLKILLIATLIAVSVLVAFVNNYSRENDWRKSRAGAERVQKEIYMYRTLHKDKLNRREWLEGRLNTIQHQVSSGMNGELMLSRPPAKIPPNFDPDNPNSDEGFKDLSGDEYIRYRLENQLAINIRTSEQHEGAWTRQQIYILLVSGVGVLLASIGGNFSIWVAVTTSLMVALIGWHGLQNYDLVVKNSRRVITELMNLYDNWNNLEQEERTNDDFFRLVKSTEEVLLGQNIEYIRPIKDVLAEETPEDTELIESTLGEAVETDETFKDEKPDHEVDISSKAIEDVLADKPLEVTELVEGALEEAVEIDEAFKDQKPDSEADITSQVVEDILAEKTPEDTELVESAVEEAVEIVEVIKDQKPESEAGITSQVVEDVLAEETPEGIELVKGVIEKTVDIDEAIKDQKPDSDADISSQAVEDVLVEETLEGPELIEGFLQEPIEPEVVITSKAKVTAGEKSEELLIEEDSDEVTGSLAEEASSELVQAEFAAMAEAVSQAGIYAVSADHAEVERLSDTLDAIAKEFKDVEIGRDTPITVLNDLLSRYPNTNEVKG